MSDSKEQLIRNFYTLLASGDEESMKGFVRASFSASASVTWPESHPRAGIISGRETLVKLFSRIAAGPPIRGGVGFQLIDLLTGERTAAARITFDWIGEDGERRPNGALEWWTFDNDGLANAIVPYYWDGHQVATKG